MENDVEDKPRLINMIDEDEKQFLSKHSMLIKQYGKENLYKLYNDFPKAFPINRACFKYITSNFDKFELLYSFLEWSGGKLGGYEREVMTAIKRYLKEIDYTNDHEDTVENENDLNDVTDADEHFRNIEEYLANFEKINMSMMKKLDENKDDNKKLLEVFSNNDFEQLGAILKENADKYNESADAYNDSIKQVNEYLNFIKEEISELSINYANISSFLHTKPIPNEENQSKSILQKLNDFTTEHQSQLAKLSFLLIFIIIGLLVKVVAF